MSDSSDISLTSGSLPSISDGDKDGIKDDSSLVSSGSSDDHKRGRAMEAAHKLTRKAQPKDDDETASLPSSNDSDADEQHQEDSSGSEEYSSPGGSPQSNNKRSSTPPSNDKRHREQQNRKLEQTRKEEEQQQELERKEREQRERERKEREQRERERKEREQRENERKEREKREQQQKEASKKKERERDQQQQQQQANRAAFRASSQNRSARYASGTESSKARQRKVNQDAPMKHVAVDDTVMTSSKLLHKVNARKHHVASRTGDQKKPDLRYCLGTKVSDIRDKGTSVFSSCTPRFVWNVEDTPAPGSYDKKKFIQHPPSPPSRSHHRRASVGSSPDKKNSKTKSKEPVEKTTIERISVYSSFAPTPLGKIEKSNKSSSWALSSTMREWDSMLIKVEKETKRKHDTLQKDTYAYLRPKQMSEKAWAQKARDEVPCTKTKPAAVAFGASRGRDTLNFGQALPTPAPGDYTSL